jgi:hypothetical protein
MNFSVNPVFFSVTFVFAFLGDYTIQKSRASLRLPERIEARRREKLIPWRRGWPPAWCVHSVGWLA